MFWPKIGCVRLTCQGGRAAKFSRSTAFPTLDTLLIDLL
jgi:hypothetical protein